MAIDNINNLDLGSFLQIIYSKGIYHQTSRDFSDWEMIKMNNIKVAPGRQYDFQLSTSLAPASTQRRNPGQSDRRFPRGFKIAHEEYTAKFKEIQTTIEVSGHLLARAAETPQKYAEVWATQAELSLDGTRRIMASELYRDGTGALGHVGSVASANGSTVRRLITLAANDRDKDSATYGLSYAGWFELNDIILPKTRAAGTSALDITATGIVGTYLKVVSIDVNANTVLVEVLDADFAPISATAPGLAETADPAATEVLYRFDQQVFPDFTAIASADFGDVSSTVVGLESLAAADGRIVHGMTLEGALAGSRVDAGGQSIDVRFLEQVLNNGKRKVGPSRYDFKKMMTSYQTRSALVESKETDRRFVSVQDNSRGSAKFNFVHGDSNIELATSEYVPEDALWILPEMRATGDKPLEYVGDEMKVAKYGNMADFHLKVVDGQLADTVQQFMRGVNLLICKHPAAILSVTNFKNQ